jgi:hypothetical protein
MEQAEQREYCQRLGVKADVSATDLERAHMRRKFSARQSGDHAAVAALDEAFAALRPVVQAREQATARRLRESAREVRSQREIDAWAEQGETEFYGEMLSDWDPRSFHSPWITILAPPLVIALAWLINLTPFKFVLQAFYIWIHEFGHATVAWMSGYKALPLPLGWTNISPEREELVYWGVLFLLAVFFIAGWRERRWWPVIIAPIIAAGQWGMTWRMEDWQVEMWIDFAGVGGEFCLSALMVALFFVNLPEKFRWGTCRYLFLFMGAACFIEAYSFWRDVYVGLEEIPWGTMLHGDGDEGGDMNRLRDGWGWSRQRIYRTYHALGQACLIALGASYLLATATTLYHRLRA